MVKLNMNMNDGEHNLEIEAKPKKNPAKKVIDHGKIVALYTANPPRTVSWIADEIGCSVQTVINHLKKEGIYKRKESTKEKNRDQRIQSF